MSQMPGSPTVPLPKKPGNSGASSSNTTPASPKLVGLALLIALIAVVLVNLYILGIKKAAQEGEYRFFRLVVAKDVGQTLEIEDVQLVGVPESFRDAFRDVVEPNSQGQPLRLGDPFTRRAEVGEPLTTRMFDDLTGDASRRLITQGYRGVSLPVVSKTLPDPLKSEMRVDLLAPVRSPGGRQVIMPVMENVRVVSVGSRTIVDEKSGSRAASNFETLTVEVDPKQAVQLEAITQEVQKTGVYRVLLRSPDDQRQAYIPEGGINPDILERFGLSTAAR
ncbi:MAG: RcpC/CpaB family pilus assembly protein [Planctomycetota bacterium]